jgi:glutamyl-tRNA synthetase
MHIGNVYAMLAAWLSAKSRGQRVLLRIEDVDVPRVLAGADRLIMDDLHWLGLDWDGFDRDGFDWDGLGRDGSDWDGPGRDGPPVYQSARTARYEYALECLRSQGVVYPCFCSRADIRAASAPNEGDGFMVYPGTCGRLLRDHPAEVRARVARGERYSLRIAMPGRPGRSQFADRVYGRQSYDLRCDVGDSVVRRADGLFAYQLAVVVDDLDMGVDDIVRGRDLLRSTALQQWIRTCLLSGGFEPQCGSVRPVEYAHLPLIANAAGRRLAKRERSLDMGALRSRGVSPERIIGYCAWLLRLQPIPEPCSPGDMVSRFSWAPLQADHSDRALCPDDPGTPRWLAE